MSSHPTLAQEGEIALRGRAQREGTVMLRHAVRPQRLLSVLDTPVPH